MATLDFTTKPLALVILIHDSRKATILCIRNILGVLFKDRGILKMESIFLHTNITIIPSSILYVSLSYYIINPCTSASSNFDDSFS